MAFLSHSKKEIKAKIVYYGPGLSGKTSNIEYIHKKMRSDHRGELVNLSTSDRTLFFDFLPVELGNIKGYRTRFHIFTVPGQVFYNETRKTVLKDVDGIVFVADSQRKMRDENIRSLKNLEENLAAYGKKLQDIPHLFQYNKRDLPDILSIEELHRQLNKTGAPFFEAVATTGNGVLNTLKLISKMVLKKLATAPVNSIQESDEAFEEKNFGLSEEYMVVNPGDKVADKESVVTAMEFEIPVAEPVKSDSEESVAPEPAEIVEEAKGTQTQEPTEYEADIQNEVDESEIPSPPAREELLITQVENPASVSAEHSQKTITPSKEAVVKETIQLSPPTGTPTASPEPTKQPPIVQQSVQYRIPKELNLYQWGFPERINQNTIRIPLFFRDEETKEEFYSYITISLENIFKR